MRLFSSRRELLSRIPAVTLLMVALSLCLHFSGNAGSLLQYDRAAINAGEWWRAITGNLVHWSFDHFLWCTLTFLALGYICEKHSPKGYMATLAISALVVPAVLWIAEPSITQYRGLSGMTSGVFTFAAMMLASQAWRTRNRRSFSLYTAAGLGYVGKIVYECFSSSTIFVKSADIFSVVPSIHLTGGLTGIAVLSVLLFNRHSRLTPPDKADLCSPAAAIRRRTH